MYVHIEIYDMNVDNMDILQMDASLTVLFDIRGQELCDVFQSSFDEKFGVYEAGPISKLQK